MLHNLMSGLSIILFSGGTASYTQARSTTGLFISKKKNTAQTGKGANIMEFVTERLQRYVEEHGWREWMPIGAYCTIAEVIEAPKLLECE